MSLHPWELFYKYDHLYRERGEIERASNWPVDFLRLSLCIPPTWQACKIWFATNGVTMLQNHLCGRDALDTDGRWVSLTADADIWDDDRDVNIDFDAKGKGRVRMKVMMVLMIMMIMMITSMSMMRNSTRTLTLMPLISVGTSIVIANDDRKPNPSYVLVCILIVSKSFNYANFGVPVIESSSLIQEWDEEAKPSFGPSVLPRNSAL